MVIVPLVVVAFAIWRILRRTFFILVDLVDFLFPILLQVMRFPLFTLRILGDGIAALLKGIVRFLPVGGDRRAAWREFVSRHWAWLRQKFSYKAFEEAVHHAFEKGMAWVFKTCHALSPRAALWVLIGAVLWLPISFGVATFMHAVLIAKALSLPAWMQLLHPVATVIAKTKLLVLPVYPAAWPQAKQHPLMQALIRFWQFLVAHYFARKTGFRYRQIEVVAASDRRRIAPHGGGDGLEPSRQRRCDRTQCGRGVDQQRGVARVQPDCGLPCALPAVRRNRAALHRALRRGEPDAGAEAQRTHARIFPALVGEVHGRVLQRQGTPGCRQATPRKASAGA